MEASEYKKCQASCQEYQGQDLLRSIKDHQQHIAIHSANGRNANIALSIVTHTPSLRSPLLNTRGIKGFNIQPPQELRITKTTVALDSLSPQSQEAVGIKDIQAPPRALLPTRATLEKDIIPHLDPLQKPRLKMVVYIDLPQRLLRLTNLTKTRQERMSNRINTRCLDSDKATERLKFRSVSLRGARAHGYQIKMLVKT